MLVDAIAIVLVPLIDNNNNKDIWNSLITRIWYVLIEETVYTVMLSTKEREKVEQAKHLPWCAHRHYNSC